MIKAQTWISIFKHPRPEVGTRIGLPDWIAGLYWIGLNFVNPNSDWDWIGLNSRGITDRIGLNFRGIADRIGLNLDRFFFNPILSI